MKMVAPNRRFRCPCEALHYKINTDPPLIVARTTKIFCLADTLVQRPLSDWRTSAVADYS
jgi:hypothetical protein